MPWLPGQQLERVITDYGRARITRILSESASESKAAVSRQPTGAPGAGGAHRVRRAGPGRNCSICYAGSEESLAAWRHRARGRQGARGARPVRPPRPPPARPSRAIGYTVLVINVKAQAIVKKNFTIRMDHWTAPLGRFAAYSSPGPGKMIIKSKSKQLLEHRIKEASGSCIYSRLRLPQGQGGPPTHTSQWSNIGT